MLYFRPTRCNGLAVVNRKVVEIMCLQARSLAGLGVSRQTGWLVDLGVPKDTQNNNKK